MRYRVVLFTCLIIVILIGWFIRQEHIARIHFEAARYFSTALRDARVNETAILHGNTFSFNDGHLIKKKNGQISDEEEFRALRLVYALTLARRSPLLGLAGTDLNALSRATNDLANVQDQLSKAQDNSRDATAVASSLYPVHFLLALAELEKRRQAFLASGADIDETRYARQLNKTLDEEKRDAEYFARVFTPLASEKTMRFPGLGGTITTESLLSTLTRIRVDIDHMEDVYQSRVRCLHGWLSFCDPVQIQVPRVQKNAVAISPINRPLLTDISAIWNEAKGNTLNGTMVALSSSACLGALPAPYYFSITTDSGNHVRNFRYNGDIFFMPTDTGNGPVVAYERDVLHISLSPQHVVAFYLCPDVSVDLGRAYALNSVISFAREHPSIATEKRNDLLASNIVYEKSAESYLKTAMTDLMAYTGQSQEILSELIALTLMYNERRGGLDFLIGEIVRINTNDLRLKSEGVPFDVSARTLLLTHSAFPSLFINTLSREEIPLRMESRGDLNVLLSGLRRYSDIRHSVTHAKIVHDIQAFLTMEGKRIGK